VLLTGTFLQPRVDLENADSVQLSQSDLISYLVTGGPSLEIGGTGTTGQIGLLAGFSIASSVLSGQLAGRYVDYVQIQGGTQDAGQSSLGNGLQLQLGVGKQITERSFLSLQGGYCQQGGLSSSPFSLASLGFRLDTRLTQGYGFSVSADPPSTQQFCSTGFTNTPRQYGLDFYRAWRF
jgi:hypothetical protein